VDGGGEGRLEDRIDEKEGGGWKVTLAKRIGASQLTIYAGGGGERQRRNREVRHI
jgi:hypothetical protein